eukprot:3895174-Pyramimonas_sp.AAC.1
MSHLVLAVTFHWAVVIPRGYSNFSEYVSGPTITPSDASCHQAPIRSCRVEVKGGAQVNKAWVAVASHICCKDVIKKLLTKNPAMRLGSVKGGVAKIKVRQREALSRKTGVRPYIRSLKGCTDDRHPAADRLLPPCHTLHTTNLCAQH